MSYQTERVVRSAFFFAGLLVALSGPWWLVCVSIVAPSLRFRAYETLALGLTCDLLWLPTAHFMMPLPLYTLLAIVAVWLCEPLRNTLLLP